MTVYQTVASRRLNAAAEFRGTLACGLVGKSRPAFTCVNLPDFQVCLDVVHMSHADTNTFLDECNQQVDEIIAACRGDLRGAVKARPSAEGRK